MILDMSNWESKFEVMCHFCIMSVRLSRTLCWLKTGIR